MYATGCRVSELAGLRLADVHLGERYCVCHGKGDKERVVPLGPAVGGGRRLYSIASDPNWLPDAIRRAIG